LRPVDLIGQLARTVAFLPFHSVHCLVKEGHA
jgi:hypothetical protein